VTDLVILDIKMMDTAEHRRWTGGGNERILENARRLAAAGTPVIVRTPVIAGVNGTPRQIGRIADFIAPSTSLMYYELLPYHDLGRGKCESLGLPCPDDGFAPPDAPCLGALVDEARARNIRVRCARRAAAERSE
jgi:pyruvate formate lyase activating enzyme